VTYIIDGFQEKSRSDWRLLFYNCIQDSANPTIVTIIGYDYGHKEIFNEIQAIFQEIMPHNQQMFLKCLKPNIW